MIFHLFVLFNVVFLFEAAATVSNSTAHEINDTINIINFPDFSNETLIPSTIRKRWPAFPIPKSQIIEHTFSFDTIVDSNFRYYVTAQILEYELQIKLFVSHVGESERQVVPNIQEAIFYKEFEAFTDYHCSSSGLKRNLFSHGHEYTDFLCYYLTNRKLEKTKTPRKTCYKGRLNFYVQKCDHGFYGGVFVSTPYCDQKTISGKTQTKTWDFDICIDL